MKLGISEILDLVAKEPNRKLKIEILKQNDSLTLRQVLQYCFAPNIKWLLPAGDVPYKPNNLTDLQSVLFAEARRLYLFVQADDVPAHRELTQLRRETLFIEFLENLDKDDAKLIVAVKDKKMPHKTITYKLVKEAFPDLLP